MRQSQQLAANRTLLPMNAIQKQTAALKERLGTIKQVKKNCVGLRACERRRAAWNWIWTTLCQGGKDPHEEGIIAILEDGFEVDAWELLAEFIREGKVYFRRSAKDCINSSVENECHIRVWGV